MLLKNLWLIRGVVESRDCLATRPQNFPGSTIGFWAWSYWLCDIYDDDAMMIAIMLMVMTMMTMIAIMMTMITMTTTMMLMTIPLPPAPPPWSHRAHCRCFSSSAAAATSLRKRKTWSRLFFTALRKRKPWIQLMAIWWCNRRPPWEKEKTWREKMVREKSWERRKRNRTAPRKGKVKEVLQVK